MGTGLVCAGFILLFNPVINVYDVLPDAIGFLLIFAGLTKLSHFFDRIDEARRLYLWLAFTGLLKIASIALVATSNNFEKGSLTLMLTFVFTLAEIGLFIPATVRMFDGFDAAGVKLSPDSSNTVVKRNGKKYNIAEKTRNFMIFFYILRCVATLLPELFELELDSVGTVRLDYDSLKYQKTTLYKFFGIVIIIVGIVYIIKTLRFFIRLKKDTAMRDAFAEMYSTALVERKSYFLARRMKTANFFFILAVLAMFPIYLDDVNIMVGVIPAVLIYVSASVMKKYVRYSPAVFPFAAAFAVMSVLSFISQIRYFDENKVEAIEWIPEAARQYKNLALIGDAECLLAFACVVAVSIVLLKSIPSHQRECGIQAESVQYSKERHDKEIFTLVVRRLTISDIFIGVMLLVRCIYRYVALDSPAFIVAVIALSVLAIAYNTYAVSSVNTLIYDKETAR